MDILIQLHFLKNGYGGHELVRDYKDIGDIRHFATSRSDKVSVHADVHKFRINSMKGCAYSLYQFVVPTERGNMVAATLLNGQLLSLREKGYSKVCAYYWADNTPAIWNTRVMNKFKESKPLKINSCWFYKKIVQ